MDNKKLYIIDGHSQIYAAYYAPMTANLMTAAGEPTKATLIFTTIILKLLREKKPDYITVAMDSAGPTFRHVQYEAYKANRKVMPDDLPPQLERIDEILRAMRIPILRVKGYEADDIIGTVSRQACAQGMNVVICSKDKDLEQCLCPTVMLYDPRGETELTLEDLHNNKGITPEQTVDVLALVGDTSDNIPGVPDVGPKTALQWVQKYGSLENLLAHADEITGKRGDNLRTGMEQARLSYHLATLDCAVPLEICWEAMKIQVPDRAKLEELFTKLEFRRLLTQLDDIAPKTEKKAKIEPTTAVFPEEKDKNVKKPAPGQLFVEEEEETDIETMTNGREIADEEEILGATRLPGDATPWQAAKPLEGTHDYRLVDTPEAFEEFYRELVQQQAFALDTETTGLNPVYCRLSGLSFSWKQGQGFYLPVLAPMGQQRLDWQMVRERLRPILENPDIKKAGQNIKYDWIVLRRAGIDLAGVEFDTMVASYLLNSTRLKYNLDSLCQDYLGSAKHIKLESLLGKGKNQVTFDMVDTRTATDYSAEDADLTWRLHECLGNLFKDKDLRHLFFEVEMPLVEVLAELEYNGVCLDTVWLKKMSTQISRRMEELTAEIHHQAGGIFNLDSPKQLSDVLFKKLGFVSLKRTKEGESTDQEVLESLRWQHPIAALMLEYRQLAKLKNTYIDKLPLMIGRETGRLHASFNQTVTATGRLSSSNPNLQNIPIRSELGQEIRRAFVPQDPGSVILAADYSQIELRLLAHFSGDEQLRQAFASGQDIHRFVAAQVYGVPLDQVTPAQRAKAKAVNFGIIYGQTAYGLSRSIGVSVEEAQKFIDEYFARYSAIPRFIEGVIEQAKKDNYVRTILGRRRLITDLNSRIYSRRKLAERMAVNTVIQGSAADLIKVAMITIHRRIQREKLPMRMILQVHDELVFELPAELAPVAGAWIREAMCSAIPVEVPIAVDLGIGPNWLECK